MELVRFPSRGGFSVRSIISFALAVITAVLLWVTLSPTSAQAATTATWSGTDTILFDNHGYIEATDFKDTTGTIPNGATIYKAPIQNVGSSQKVFILYFSPGVDPPTATTVKYVQFDYDNGQISNPHAQQDVSLALQGTSDGTGSSCSVTGIGWIICPVSMFLAEAMDNIFNILSKMIEVKPPVLGDTNNSMYIAWNIMRTIANIAFVIVFLIIIYAQLTNLGVSNYGLKKLIPRLIIAAVLVNISFYISALAIDISNILGYSIQDIFNTIREEVFHMTNDELGTGAAADPWTAVTTLILAGGGVLAGGAYYAAAGGLYLLIPLLLGLVLTIIFVVIVLAARQAIILILVIIAPLAFVANLLPNTEKWFDKWKDLFMTMLIFFPAFSLVFGGSQLAGQIIIQNAGDDIILLLFGMAVQIAPLVITPLLLRLSGSLLGRIAQLANNPRKGALDRTKGWAERRAEHAKNQNIARGGRWYNPASYGSGMVRRMDYRKRRLAEKTEVWKQAADNRYKQTDGYEKIHIRMFEVEAEKQIVENSNKKHIQSEINRPNSTLHLQNARMEAGKRVLEQTVKITEATFKEYDAGRVPVGGSVELQDSIRRMQAARQGTQIETMRAGAADTQIQREFAQVLKDSATLRQHAGGIKPLGADSVLASAVSQVRAADSQDIKNIQDASDIPPGRLDLVAAQMKAAVLANNNIEARAYQNMLVTAGGAGMDTFRKTMLEIGTTAPVEVTEYMRENMLSNHGALKAKSNDLIDWASKGDAAKGFSLGDFTYDSKAWRGLSDKDFINQHPKSQLYAFKAETFDADRARSILAADVIEGNVLTEDVKKRLNLIIDGRVEDSKADRLT